MLVQAAQPNEALLQQAVSEGRVRPFHELMEVASRLPVRVLRVDLGERMASGSTSSGSSTGRTASSRWAIGLTIWRWVAQGHHLERLFAPRPPRKRSNGVSPRTYRRPVRPQPLPVPAQPCFGYPCMRILIVEDEKISRASWRNSCVCPVSSPISATMAMGGLSRRDRTL